MDTYEAGTTVYIEDTLRDTDDVLLDPTSAKVTITDPDGVVKVDAENMTKKSTGVYYYNWQSEVTDPTGIYEVKTVAVSGGYTSIKTTERGFCLK